MWRCVRCEVINKDEDAKCQICGMTASCSQKWTAFLDAEEQRRAAAAEQAEKQFARYKKCRDVYVRLWQQGRSVLQLTVAA